MNPRQIGAAPGPPLALGVIPQCTNHLPARSMIRRSEQPARQGSAPKDARLIGIAGGERPDASRAPVDRASPHILLFITVGLGRVDRDCNFLPAASIRAMELHSEMSMVERRIIPALAPIRERQRDVI